MSRLFYLAIILPVLVFTFSTSRSSFTGSLNLAFNDVEENFSSTFLSEKDFQSFILPPSGESLSGPGIQYPVPDSRFSSGSAGLMALLVEKRREQLAQQYVLYARAISPALTIREILYPFHFFW